jgi:hypothetical protein
MQRPLPAGGCAAASCASSRCDGKVVFLTIIVLTIIVIAYAKVHNSCMCVRSGVCISSDCEVQKRCKVLHCMSVGRFG